MVVAARVRCASCNHDNSSERRFCGECGVPLAAMCAACGASNQLGEKFCGGCGARLPTVAAAPGVTSPATPGASLPAGERRHLPVLFSDLVGSTELSTQLDPEELHDRVAQYYIRWSSGATESFG